MCQLRLGSWLSLVAVMINFGVGSASTNTYGDCTHLENCNGHGTCNKYTRTCDCYDGWGSSRDLSSTKSPDCSTSKLLVTSTLE